MKAQIIWLPPALQDLENVYPPHSAKAVRVENLNRNLPDDF